MSNPNICTVDNYNTSHITVSKPYHVNDDTYVFNIKYNKSMCLIQTPTCIIPYSYSLYDDNSFKLDIQTEMEGVYKMMNAICSHILKKINNYNQEYIKDKNIQEVCSKVQDKYKLSLRNKDANNVYTFNSKQEPISLTTLHTFDKVICLFELNRLVIKKEKVFWQTNLVQIKKCSSIIQPSFSQCLIMSNDTGDIYTKYSKMFQMKIPADAIKHKMFMDGLTENDFNQWSKSLCVQNGPRPAPPPPPPPPPSLNLLKGVKSGPEFLKDISLGNFQLKKAKSNDIKQKILSSVKAEYAPPSLNDIRNALSKLKKTNLDV
jgi:Subunit CCDC53 of WASH complex